jgi:hypothetical protein
MPEPAPKPPLRLTGTCLCGAVTYTVPDSFEYALNCHCSQCRRTTGAAYKPIAGIKSDQLTLTKGADTILRYGPDPTAHNAHCAKCGSFLYSIVRAGTYAHIAMGTLIDTPTIRPAAHIFVASKAPWHNITDDLPQFDEFPPG